MSCAALTKMRHYLLYLHLFHEQVKSTLSTLRDKGYVSCCADQNEEIFAVFALVP